MRIRAHTFGPHLPVVTIGVAVDAGIGGESVTNVAEVDSETEDPDRTNNRTELTNEIDRPEPPPGPTLAPPVEPGPTGQLPRTGADVLRGVLVGLVLVAAGGAVLALRRRARPTTTF